MRELERAFREQRAVVVATLARRLGDLSLAEDCVQEAFASAAVAWAASGVPDRPGAWLTTTAWRKALDVLRRERASPGPTGDGPTGPPDEPGLESEDVVLQLLLTCCHPALSMEARVALTLRHVAGLTAREIAGAFLLPEETMAKRLVRARAKVRDSGISFELPEPAALPERMSSARAVVYLVFTEGHLSAGDGPAVRAELCDEAVWLARQLHRLAPDDPETTGLLALLLFQNARAGARVDAGGRLVPFDEQDKDRWDPAAVAEARALLGRTGRGPVGPYQVQAAIAALHAAAPSAGEIAWGRIAELYGLLGRLAPSPVVTVNEAVAVGRARGPEAALVVLAPALADERLARYAPLHAAHADLLERAGRRADAAGAWRHAAALAPNAAQRDEFERRAKQADGGVLPGGPAAS
jgi:RNA polymerase sigma-70 factor (ECF subfamily)